MADAERFGDSINQLPHWVTLPVIGARSPNVGSARSDPLTLLYSPIVRLPVPEGLFDTRKYYFDTLALLLGAKDDSGNLSTLIFIVFCHQKA